MLFICKPETTHVNVDVQRSLKTTDQYILVFLTHKSFKGLNPCHT